MAASVRNICLRAFLYSLIGCSLGFFVVITCMRPTPFYSANEDFENAMDNMDLQFGGDVSIPTQIVEKKGKKVEEPIGRANPLWSGNSAFPVALQWGTLMIAALATAGLRHLAPNPSHISYSPKAGSSIMSIFILKMRQLLSTQVAPAHFWSWWCGGLNVFEVFLVLLWFAVNLIYLVYYTVRNFERNRATDAAEYAIERLDGFAATSGKALFVTVMVMFLPISRSNFLQWLFGTDYTVLIKYHRWMSKGTILLVFIHSMAYMILWGAEGTLSEQISWDNSVRRKARQNVCGTISTVAGLIIYFFSSSYFQKNHFWVFYHVHIWGFLIFTVFAVLHYKAYVNWMFPALVLYGIDRGFRYWQMAVNWTTIRPADAVVDNGMLTVQLRWKQQEGKTINAGQHIWLRCPAISIFEAHPVSVADVQKGDGDTVVVTFHFRCFGAWTTKLANKIAQGHSVSAQVEGPYLASLDHTTTFTKAPVMVMVAGGIGVTPILALLRHYARQFSELLPGNNTTPHPKVYFVWTSRHLSDLKLFGTDLLAASRNTVSTSSCSPPSSSPQSSVNLDKNALQTCSSDASTCDVPAASVNHLVTRLVAEGKGAGWLHAALHYTGFELENDHGVKVNMQPERSRSMDTSDSSIGAVLAGPRLLNAHPSMRPWLYALCILLGFFGGWAGLLLGAYFDNYSARKTASGADYQGSATVYCVGIALGSILVPFLVLALHWLVTSRRNQTSDGTTTPASDISDPKLGKTMSIASSTTDGIYNTSLTVLPGYVLAPLSEVGGVVLGRGRPDIRSVLRAVARLHGDVQEIPVLVAASDAMALPVERMCADHNASRPENGPVFMITRVAHHH